jgi:hypothetical protein
VSLPWRGDLLCFIPFASLKDEVNGIRDQKGFLIAGKKLLRYCHFPWESSFYSENLFQGAEREIGYRGIAADRRRSLLIDSIRFL